MSRKLPIRHLCYLEETVGREKWLKFTNTSSLKYFRTFYGAAFFSPDAAATSSLGCPGFCSELYKKAIELADQWGSLSVQSAFRPGAIRSQSHSSIVSFLTTCMTWESLAILKSSLGTFKTEDILGQTGRMKFSTNSKNYCRSIKTFTIPLALRQLHTVFHVKGWDLYRLVLTFQIRISPLDEFEIDKRSILLSLNRTVNKTHIPIKVSNDEASDAFHFPIFANFGRLCQLNVDKNSFHFVGKRREPAVGLVAFSLLYDDTLHYVPCLSHDCDDDLALPQQHHLRLEYQDNILHNNCQLFLMALPLILAIELSQSKGESYMDRGFVSKRNLRLLTRLPFPLFRIVFAIPHSY
ncbi:hypothetical protein CCUS01_06113 [Colletotrichum cuscutae]|uniref:Uncharacterized protein n=1 Tax=Colletotrichum cuscutae TaxID=1209917 RepID=A0AAI9V532_9PEZI|nr:hypothetical protein CCUS01_06113 [Colletotrichum cuscutae]